MFTIRQTLILCLYLSLSHASFAEDVKDPEQLMDKYLGFADKVWSDVVVAVRGRMTEVAEGNVSGYGIEYVRLCQTIPGRVPNRPKFVLGHYVYEQRPPQGVDLWEKRFEDRTGKYVVRGLRDQPVVKLVEDPTIEDAELRARVLDQTWRTSGVFPNPLAAVLLANSHFRFKALTLADVHRIMRRLEFHTNEDVPEGAVGVWLGKRDALWVRFDTEVKNRPALVKWMLRRHEGDRDFKKFQVFSTCEVEWEKVKLGTSIELLPKRVVSTGLQGGNHPRSRIIEYEFNSAWDKLPASDLKVDLDAVNGIGEPGSKLESRINSLLDRARFNPED